jgi:hypothetical protein
MNLRIDVEDARAAAVLVERAVAEFVKNRARDCAFQHAQRPEAVGNAGDHPGFHPHLRLGRAGFAARQSDHFGELRKRHDVAADISVGDECAQERAGIVG